MPLFAITLRRFMMGGGVYIHTYMFALVLVCYMDMDIDV